MANKTEELIEHWMWLAQAVFHAEDKVQIRDGWREKLRGVKKKTAEEREQIAQEYLRAIATEIVMHADDEE